MPSNNAKDYIPGLGEYFKFTKDDVDFVVLTNEQYAALEKAYIAVHASNSKILPAVEELDMAHQTLVEGIYYLNKANMELARRLDATTPV